MAKKFNELTEGDIIYYFDGTEISTHSVTGVSEGGWIRAAWKKEPWKFKPNNPKATVEGKREYKSMLSLLYTAWGTDYDELKKNILEEQTILECGFKTYRVEL